MYIFTTENHYQEFNKYAQELISKEIPKENRIQEIEELINSYVEDTNERPPAFALEKLANFLLKEHLSDKNPDKLSNSLYPVLSERQQRTRDEKEFVKCLSTLDYINLRKTSKLHNLSKRNTSGKGE